MASKKKGCIVLKKDGYLKVTYIHRNSEPAAIGKRLVQVINELGVEALKAYYDEVQLVREEDPMTDEQRQSYKKYMPEQLWKEDLTWPQALAYTKDATAPMKDRYPWMVDYAGFNGAWVNRWRYIVDFDENLFIIVRGGNEMIMHESDEYEKELEWFGKMAHTEVGRFPLDNIPKDWVEQIKEYWSDCMVLAVPHHMNSEAEYSDLVQSHSKKGYNPYDYEWEKIKFFYGQNHYAQMLADWGQYTNTKVKR